MTVFEDLKAALSEVDRFLAGQRSGYKVTLPAEIDVKRIRLGLHMTQAKFSASFGFSLDAVKHWEGGRRTPEASARAFLTVIAKNPRAVIAALHSTKRELASIPHATVRKASRAPKTLRIAARGIKRPV